MSFPYIQNLAGWPLTSKQVENIGHPHLELHTHVTLKCAQAGGVLGTLFVGPLWAASRKITRNRAGFSNSMKHCGKWGVVIGLIAGPAMCYTRVRNEDTIEPIYDRCYRLRKNRNQVRADRGYIIGGGVGAMISMTASSSPLFGFLIGSSSALIGTGMYNITVSKYG